MKRFLVGATLTFLFGCTIKSSSPNLDDQDVRLTVLHTADIHSKLLAYRFDPGATDQGLGLSRAAAGVPSDVEYTVGGVDRLAYLIWRERAKAARSIHLDSGDGYQGAPIFNIWRGEAELRAMSELGVNVQVIGNHEFDASAARYADNLEAYAAFPALAANYLFDDPTKPWNNTLARVAQPWSVVDVSGLRVGVVGMGNLDSLNSITEQGNSLGIKPLESIYAAETAVEQVRHFSDLVVLVTHMGPDEDALIAENVRHIDVIMGGHLHVALDPPMVVEDPDGRQVIIAHSSAFAKYLGRLDLVLEKSDDPDLAREYGFEVASHKFTLFPVDNRVDMEIEAAKNLDWLAPALNRTAKMRNLMEEYRIAMVEMLDLDRTVGCSTNSEIPRFGALGGDSPFGNIVTEAMQTHDRVQSDFAITNAGGIRDNLRGRVLDATDPRACVDGEGNVGYSIELNELYTVIPFDNTITTMFLTGTEVVEVFDWVAERSSQRGCASQAHTAGATVRLSCHGDVHVDRNAACTHDTDCENGVRGVDGTCDAEGACWYELPFPHADNITIGGQPIEPSGSYELAANSYIAAGGSGFEVLQRNTTQVDTFISQRDAVVEYFAKVGTVPCNDADPDLPDCRGSYTKVGIEDGRIVVGIDAGEIVEER